MNQSLKLDPEVEEIESEGVTVEQPELDPFDRIRALLVKTGLPPVPMVYDLLWRYLAAESQELSRAIDFAMTMHNLDLRMAMTLHSTYCVKWHDD